MGTANMKMSTALKREHDFGVKWVRRLSESIEFVSIPREGVEATANMKMSTALRREHDFRVKWARR